MIEWVKRVVLYRKVPPLVYRYVFSEAKAAVGSGSATKILFVGDDARLKAVWRLHLA